MWRPKYTHIDVQTRRTHLNSPRARAEPTPRLAVPGALGHVHAVALAAGGGAGAPVFLHGRGVGRGDTAEEYHEREAQIEEEVVQHPPNTRQFLKLAR